MRSSSRRMAVGSVRQVRLPGLMRLGTSRQFGKQGNVEMDHATLSAYERDAKVFADDWETQPTAVDLQSLIDEFFIPGRTADIGCGSGRDAAWLDARGYPTIGFNASEALLAEARRRHPQVQFGRAVLPELAAIVDGSFSMSSVRPSSCISNPSDHAGGRKASGDPCSRWHPLPELASDRRC